MSCAAAAVAQLLRHTEGTHELAEVLTATSPPQRLRIAGGCSFGTKELKPGCLTRVQSVEHAIDMGKLVFLIDPTFKEMKPGEDNATCEGVVRTLLLLSKVEDCCHQIQVWAAQAVGCGFPLTSFAQGGLVGVFINVSRPFQSSI